MGVQPTHRHLKCCTLQPTEDMVSGAVKTRAGSRSIEGQESRQGPALPEKQPKSATDAIDQITGTSCHDLWELQIAHGESCGQREDMDIPPSSPRTCKEIWKRIALEPVPSLTIARERQRDSPNKDRKKISTIFAAPGSQSFCAAPLFSHLDVRALGCTLPTNQPTNRKQARSSRH